MLITSEHQAHTNPSMSDEPGEIIQRVGQRLQKFRKEARISRKRLSELSGVSLRYLAQMEGGEGNVSIALLQRIAVALKLPIEALFASQEWFPDEGGHIASLYRQADATTQTRVRELLDAGNGGSQKAQRICLIGLRGAGKSTLGNLLAREFSIPFVELNSEIEQLAGIPVSEIFSLYGEDGYRQLESQAIDRVISGHAQVVLAAVGGIVSTGDTFDRVLDCFHTVWITAQPAEHMERVRAQGDLRPMRDNPQAMKQLRQILASRETRYARAQYRLDTSGKRVVDSHRELGALVRGLIGPAAG